MRDNLQNYEWDADVRYQRYLTIVYAVPPGWDVGQLTGHEYASAFAWSHKMDECNGLIADYEKQKHRADALAATIRELQAVVTHDGETKADFVARVRKILGADPDARVTHNAALTGGEAVPVESTVIRED